MRTTTIALVALVALVASPTAEAKKGKGKGKGGGHNDGPTVVIAGAGQRLHFSFGGRMLVKDGKIKGNFTIVSHPLAPSSTRLTVACRYQEFKNVSIAGPRLEFEGKGNCGVLNLDGKLDKISVKNKFVIVDAEGSDQIDVEIVGATGIMIPGGNLEFGDFTFTTH